MSRGEKTMLMHFRIKHFDRYVGLFVIIALILIVITLLSVGKEQRWFEKRHRYTVVFNKVPGLKAGTPVTISGMEVGTVQSLRLNPQNKVQLTLEVSKTYSDYIRRDSQATIASALIGGKTVDITVGSPGEPLLPEGGNIASLEPKELSDILKDVDVKTPLKKLDDALENVKSITQKLNDPQGELFTLLKNVEFVTAQLKNGQGNIGGILQDKEMHRGLSAAIEAIRRSAANIEETTQNISQVSRDLPKIVSQVDQSVKEVPKILDEVKKATSNLPKIMGDLQQAAGQAPGITKDVKGITEDVKEITGNVKQAAPEIPDFLSTTHESVEEAERLIQGLQNHWLLRGSMPKVPRDTPLEISQRESPYGGGASR
jgi:phospholipid/cholesterol/gamma-HCH transport system substrate-binding protein